MNNEMFITFMVLGTLIMAGYGKMAMAKAKEQNALWSNKGKNRIKQYGIKGIYQFMILISMISGAYLMYYLSTHPSDDLRTTGVMIFLSFSLVWAFAPFVYPKAILLFVSVGIVLVLASIAKSNDTSTEGSLAIAATSILLFQTFVFDFGIWARLI